MTRRRADACDPIGGVSGRLEAPGGAERMADPLGDGHTPRARDPPELAELPLVEQHLQALSHAMSLNDSS